MKVREIMTTDVASVAQESTVIDAAKLMEQYDVGSIPVTGQNGVVGMLTDRDIVLRNIVQGKDPNSTKVKDVMTGNVITASPDMDVDDAIDIMAEQQIRRLPVVENNKLIGIVAMRDIAIEEIYDFETGEAISEISEDRE